MNGPALHPNALAAPQATLMASVAKGIFGGEPAVGHDRDRRADRGRHHRGRPVPEGPQAPFHAPVLAVAVGIYLPLELSVPIFVGGLISHVVERRLGIHGEGPEAERAKQNGILFAAGPDHGRITDGNPDRHPDRRHEQLGRAGAARVAAVRQAAGSRHRRLARTLAVPDGDESRVNAGERAEPGPRFRILAAYATIYLVWGSTFLVIRLGVRSLPPMLFAGGRFVSAGALLVAIAALMRERFPSTGLEWRYILAFSLLMIACSSGASTIALTRLPSNEGALLSAGSALWIAWLGALGPKGHKLTLRGSLGLLLGLAGVALLVWPRSASPSGHFGWQSLVLIGSLCWAIGTVLYRNAALAVGPVAFNAVTMLLGGTWLLLAGAATGEAHAWRWEAGGLAAMAYLAVFGSAIAYTAYTWLLRHSPADRVGTFAYVNPAIAAMLGWAVLGEALEPAQLAGMLVVLLGVALVTFGK